MRTTTNVRKSDNDTNDDSAETKVSAISLFRNAFSNRTFRLLVAGFSTCGFHMVIIESHLFSQFKSYGIAGNAATAVLFSVGLGMTGDATVSPTSGLVNREFKIQEVATLVGFLFLCHQIGAFFSAWLGGVLLNATGGYNAVWLIDVALCAFASVMSGMIRGGK